MKKIEGIKKRAEYVEWKSGKIYAKPDGSLYKFFNGLCYIAFFYTLIINLLYIVGVIMHLSFDTVADKKSILGFTSAVCVCTLLLITYFVLSRLKFSLLAPIFNIVPSLTLGIMFVFQLKAGGLDKALFGLKYSYYYNHLLPLFIILLCSIIMIIIALRAKMIFNKFYRETEMQLYDLYTKNTQDPTEESWLEFAKNYDGTSPKNLFN